MNIKRKFFKSYKIGVFMHVGSFFPTHDVNADSPEEAAESYWREHPGLSDRPLLVRERGKENVRLFEPEQTRVTARLYRG